ncbi:MAG: hypothetical protein GXO78_15280 [Calditrichaeota bacterium]|nr:hypothetical protein [Calditrichota bacterium]
MPNIEAYDFGYIVIDGQRYTHDVIVFPDRVQGNWWRREGHRLYPEDLPFLQTSPPRILVIGQGKYGRMEISSPMRELLERLGIEWYASITDEAVERFRQLQQTHPADVVGAFHLTC